MEAQNGGPGAGARTDVEEKKPVHVDAKTWKEHWSEIRAGPRGGQGAGKVVAGRSNGIQVAFLKILNSQGDVERRKRAYREVVALETVSVPGVPRILETNAHQHGDLAYKLYVVTEFVEGRTLSDVVTSGRVSAASALVWMNDLCDILAHCHAETVRHRDIKPDNIIIGPRGADPERLHVVDFGQAFTEADTTDFSTPDAQELGNRFLHLSELQGGSENKQDVRSDVTMAVGILFYMLTGEAPVNLLDHENNMPHQRPIARARLEEAGLNTIRVFNLFDKGFAHTIEQRFRVVEELRESLARVTDTEPDDGVRDVERAALRIRERLEGQSRLNAAANRTALNTVFKHIDHINMVMRAGFNDALIYTQTGFDIDPAAGRGINSLGFQLAHAPSKAFQPSYEATIHGSEIVLVVTAQNAPSLTERIPLGRGLPEDAVARVHAYLIAALEQLLS